MIVNYTAPASNGGLTIKKYTATNNSGTSSASASSTAVRYVQHTSQKLGCSKEYHEASFR